MFIDKKDNINVIELPPHLNYKEAYNLENLIFEEMKTGPRDFILDAEKLEFLDSNAIGTLVHILKTLQADAGKLIFRNLQGYVLSLFRETSLDKIFPIESINGLSQYGNAPEDTVGKKVEITSEESADYKLFHVSGSIIFPKGIEYLKKEVLEALKERKIILLDFKELVYFDSSSVAELIGISQLMKETGATLRVYGVNGFVNDLFEAIGLRRIIEIYDSRDNAIAG